MFFFFSSRRRHTRYWRDWSSTCALPISVHEAGHVLCAELCPTHEKAERATIQPRGKAAGMAVYGRVDRSLMSERYIHERRSEERRVGKEGRSRWSPYH